MTNEEKLQKIIDLAHQVLADMEYEEVPRLPIEIHVWVDGGCKNPGTENARGYYSVRVMGDWGTTHHEERILIDSIDPQTNNVAEYHALLQGLFWIKDYKFWGGSELIVIHTDSQLVIGQLIAGWKINFSYLKHLNHECAQLLDELRKKHSIVLMKEPREAIESVLGH